MLWHKRSLVINCPEYLFIRKVKGVVKSVKNASKISAAGLEGFLLQGRADWRVSQTAALPAASLASQSEFLAGGCLPPWCGCPRGASRGEIFSDGPREAFPMTLVSWHAAVPVLTFITALLNFLPLKWRFGRTLSIQCLSHGERQSWSSCGCIWGVECKAQGCRASGCDGWCL